MKSACDIDAPALICLIEDIEKYNPSADTSTLRKAYHFASKAHEGQVRLSGKPYFTHCLEVARILVDLHLDVTTISAGLLHDVLEDTSCNLKQITNDFGKEVAHLVHGVTKINVTITRRNHEERQVENLRRMLVAMTRDIRVIVIKLCDRLHNMRTLGFLPAEKTRRVAHETLDVYAPLAHRMGFGRMKWELEDLAFRYLHEKEYRDLAAKLSERRGEREKNTQETCKVLLHHLEHIGIRAKVSGRPKHLYGIYRKMVDQGKGMDEIYDLTGVRILAETIKDCYAALGTVHTIWKPLPGRFKDYIAMPKSNMYQSLHTCVLRETGQPLEVQIRTFDMHRTADEGIAAHWRYKKQDVPADEQLDQQVMWMRQMFEWAQDMGDTREFMENLKGDLLPDEVYAFTPKGDVKALPSGSTPVDFAYAIHSDIGNHCIGARVNGKQVSLRYNLQQGDVVEIVTVMRQNPVPGWLEFVRSSKARSRIRHYLRQQEQADGLGTTEHDVKEDKFVSKPGPPDPPDRLAATADQLYSDLVYVEDMPGIEVRYAQCCNPKPGDKIVGYLTKGRGVSIHRASCQNTVKTGTNTARFLKVAWKQYMDKLYPAALRLITQDRPNLLMDILNVMSEQQANIHSLYALPSEGNNGDVELAVELSEQGQIIQIVSAIRQINGVNEVREIPFSKYLRMWQLASEGK
ncbi:RelA/SpoT family protein [Candidatus Hydrogenedentota bacterium]